MSDDTNELPGVWLDVGCIEEVRQRTIEMLVCRQKLLSSDVLYLPAVAVMKLVDKRRSGECGHEWFFDAILKLLSKYGAE